MRKLMIAPSVGCCDLFHVEEQVKLINEKSDYLHMDIKDGVYVPSYGIGPDYLDYLNKHVENLKPMDAHLMVKHPQQYLETFAKAGAAYITPHTDCIEGDAFVTIHKIKELGCKAGVALSPSVPLSTIEYYLPLLDKVTIMIVDPGIAGQPVDPQMFVKINQLAKISQARFQPTVHQRFQLTLLQKLKQAMLLSLMLRSQAGIMLSQYSVTFGRLTVQAIGRHGSQRKKNVSTILQQVSLHMIFQRQVTQSLSQTEEFTV